MEVTVINREGSLTTEIGSEHHLLFADEPKQVGGHDKGPSPYEYLLASLGSCTAMTLRLYADHKGWDLEEVKISLNHNKDYPTDCEDCENSASKIDVIEKKIELIGNLDDPQKNRLLEIADKCPVHKTLNSSIEIRTVQG
ncbi:MAG: OsmC family protein [Reichenbachiella sp.]